MSEIMVPRFGMQKNNCKSELAAARGAQLHANRLAGIERTLQERIASDAADEEKRRQEIETAKVSSREEGITDIERKARRRVVAQLMRDNFTAFPPVMSLEEMLEDLIFVSKGSFVCSKKNPHFMLKKQEAKAHFAGNITPKIVNGEPVLRNGIPVMVDTFDIWTEDIRRLQVQGRTFGPGRGPICKDPNGALCANSWRKAERKIMQGPLYEKHIQVITEHITFVFGNMSEKFIDYVAFIEQQPEINPQTGWLNTAVHHGIGRNWIASVLERVFIGYVASSMSVETLLKDGFNGQLAGKVLAVIDEIRAGTTDKYAAASQMRKTISESVRQVNPKCEPQYSEHCVCRWVMFSNHLDALPVDDKDRRIWVYTNKEKPRSKETYTKLYDLLDDDDFIASVAYWLSQRDLTGKDVTERPEMNESKIAMIATTENPMTALAREICENWPAEYITNNDVATLLSADGSERDGNVHQVTPAMKRCMDDAGAAQLIDTRPGKSGVMIIKANDKRVRVWRVRGGGPASPETDYIREQLDLADTKLGYNRVNSEDQFNNLRKAFAALYVDNTDEDNY